MSLALMNGFDLQDESVRGYSQGGNGSNQPSSVTPFGIGYSWQFNSVGNGYTTFYAPVFTPAAQIFTGFAIRCTGWGPDVLWIATDSGATNHLQLNCDSAGTIQVYRGGTNIASSTAGVLPADGAWRYLEVSATIATSGGTLTVKVNGSTVLTFTGNTRNGGTSTNIDQLKWGLGAGVGSMFIDDFYAADATGSAPLNTFLGAWVRVQTLTPNGAGSSTQFTPTSGANYTTVNDVPDNTSTYNSDTVSGHRDTFAMTDPVSNTGTVYAVQQVMHARQLDGGIATIKQAQKSGSTVSYGATKTLTASNLAYTDLFTTNPATTAAYTVADLTALEAGYELV